MGETFHGPVHMRRLSRVALINPLPTAMRRHPSELSNRRKIKLAIVPREYGLNHQSSTLTNGTRTFRSTFGRLCTRDRGHVAPGCL